MKHPDPHVPFHQYYGLIAYGALVAIFAQSMSFHNPRVILSHFPPCVLRARIVFQVDPVALAG